MVKLELQGNDFELGIRLTIDGDIKEPGTLVVGSPLFPRINPQITWRYYRTLQTRRWQFFNHHIWLFLNLTS